MPLPKFPSTLFSSLFNKAFATRAHLVIATAIVLAASVVSLWAAARLNPRSSVPTTPVQIAGEPATPVVQRNQRPAEPAPPEITVETVTLTFDGFEPKELERPAGRFVFGVDNRTRIADISFELLRENGHEVHQLKMTHGQLRLRKMLNLPAGSYTLRVVDHPEWTCSIELTR